MNPNPPPHARILDRLGCHAPHVLTAVAAGLLGVELLRPWEPAWLPAPASWAGGALGALALLAHGHHQRSLCVACLARTPWENPARAARRRLLLLGFHRRWWCLLVFLVVLLAPDVSPWLRQPGVLRAGGLVEDAALACFFALEMVHRPLAPLCPYCRRGRGGGGGPAQTPVPDGPPGRVRPTPVGSC